MPPSHPRRVNTFRIRYAPRNLAMFWPELVDLIMMSNSLFQPFQICYRVADITSAASGAASA